MFYCIACILYTKMGYDVELMIDDNLEERLYLSYNHCAKFKEFGIYPRDLNGKNAKDIIDLFNEATNELETNKDKYDLSDDPLESINEGYTKYTRDIMYEDTYGVFYRALMTALKILKSVNENAIWKSD